MDVGSRTDVEGACNVGMVEFGGGHRLAFESFQIRRFRDPLHRQNLDRHFLLKHGMLAQIDAAHATGGKQF